MGRITNVTLFLVVIVSACTRQSGPPPAHQEIASVEAATPITYEFAANGPCPEGTVLVEGDYCPVVEQTCAVWVDNKGAATSQAIPDLAKGQTGRCGTWASSRCLSEKKVHKRFCIDLYEYPNVKGVRPQSWVSWRDMKRACEGQGKRLCTQSEWTFACEGPNIQPYPYGDGMHRDRTACNIDNDVPKGVNVLKVKNPASRDARALDALLVPSGSMPRCVSPFGVYDMVGNIDESVVNESGRPYQSGLMSGHVFGVRNACRPMTIAHNESFSWYESGGRCCISPTN